jgi:hypothetical protein
VEVSVSDCEREEAGTGGGQQAAVIPPAQTRTNDAAGKAAQAVPVAFMPVIVICLLTSLLSSAMAIVVYDRFFSLRIDAIDIKGYIDEQREKYVAGKINDDELRRSFDRLEDATRNIPSNHAVIMGDAVVRNVRIIKP